MAYKVFTNGSTLQASEVNDNLMKQAVATFSNVAARTAAITSPVEGQLTYLEDLDRYEHWTGSAWVSPFGLTLLKTVTTTGVSSVDVQNCFSATYDFYKIIIRAIHSTGSVGNIRLLSGSTPNTTANYGYIGSAITSSAAEVLQAAFNATSWDRSGAQTQQFFEYELAAPFLTEETRGVMRQMDGATFRSFGLRHTLANSYDGFQYFPSTGTISSLTLSVFGYRK